MSNWTESRKFHSPRDRDTIYGNDVRQRIAALGIQMLTAPRSPWQNAYAERLIGSIRRDCLNHFVILNARHLKKNPEFLFRLLPWVQNPFRPREAMSLPSAGYVGSAKSQFHGYSPCQSSRYKDGTTEARSLPFSPVPYGALQSDRCLVITT